MTNYVENPTFWYKLFYNLKFYLLDNHSNVKNTEEGIQVSIYIKYKIDTIVTVIIATMKSFLFILTVIN